MTRPWLTVLTVVRDDAEGFRRTVASVASQALGGVELLVVDGSTDRESIPAALAGHPAAASVARVDWREPRGIYAAMNDGLDIARGDQILFLNAGDTFFDPSVLASVRPLLLGRTWGFGPVEIVETSGRRIIPPVMDYAAERRRGFARGRFPAHQGTFAAREALIDLGGFDPSFAIAADYAMALRLSLRDDPVLLPFVIATFREGGLSSQRRGDSFAEFHRARREILELSGPSSVVERWDTERQRAEAWLARTVRPRVLRMTP